MTETSQAKFFLTAQQGGYYSGTIILPTGSKYTGRIYANKGPNGDWYRGDLMAADGSRFNEDARIKADDLPEGIDARSKLKPLELRLNSWPNGKADLIGNLWTSEGVFTFFVNQITHDNRPALAGNIKPLTARASSGLDTQHDADLEQHQRDQAFDLSETGYPNADKARTGATARAAKAAAPQPLANKKG